MRGIEFESYLGSDRMIHGLFIRGRRRRHAATSTEMFGREPLVPLVVLGRVVLGGVGLLHGIWLLPDWVVEQDRVVESDKAVL